jgi:hypothetical protein
MPYRTNQQKQYCSCWKNNEVKPMQNQNRTEYGIDVVKYIKTPNSFAISKNIPAGSPLRFLKTNSTGSDIIKTKCLGCAQFPRQGIIDVVQLGDEGKLYVNKEPKLSSSINPDCFLQAFSLHRCLDLFWSSYNKNIFCCNLALLCFCRICALVGLGVSGPATIGIVLSLIRNGSWNYGLFGCTYSVVYVEKRTN